MEVIKFGDQNELIETKDFSLAHFPFEKFNPVQSRVFEFYDQDANCLVAAATSSGKTAVAEMLLAHEVRVRGGKGMYLGPLKALTQEKIDDWTSEGHHFSDLNISICTGDYRLTPERKKELENSDLIIMTTEMLNSRVRNFKSENNEWLKEVGTIVSDEIHILTVPGRGDHIEAALMKFTLINPDARIVGLSATMPNVEEIAEWLGFLNKKPSHMLESTYRPCPLYVHYEEYWDGAFSYDAKEASKVNQALGIIKDYPEDKFLVFVHTKRTGKMMINSLGKSGIKCEYHNADVDLKTRLQITDRFKNDPDLRAVVATSTLAWGCNFPARRVIVTGVHRGLSEVEDYDIKQMVGRSGRPGYDKVGDAYVLLPEKHFDEHKARLEEPRPIKSQMLDVDDEEGSNNVGHHKVLAFHIVSEIHHGGISTREDVHEWYRRSLAHFQAQELEDEVVDTVLELLMNCGAIREEDGDLKCNAVGKISSLFYYSPFDVSDLRSNFNVMFENGNENNDFWLATALGNTDTNRCGIVSKAEREEMEGYARLVRSIFGEKSNEAAIKAGFIYYQLLNGYSSQSMAGLERNFQFDFPRVIQVLGAIDNMSTKWSKKDYFKKVRLRVAYGVGEDLIYLCQIPNIGKVRAKKLHAAGLQTVEDVATNPEKVKKSLNMKQEVIDKIVEEAAKLVISGEAS
jgi:replicative superfamily II helicase